MSIWYYLFLIVFIISIILSIKLLIIKSELRNIETKLNRVINSDTNNLLTISSNDKDLIRLIRNLNKNLKYLRKLELEYINGNSELKESITNISHDLRTPLTAIRGYLDLIDEENLSSKQKKYFKYIDDKTSDLINLTEQLFDFTKSLENNSLNKKDVCLNSFLENIIGSYYTIFKSKNIEPKINIARNKIIRKLDENMLTRIFENIISNSLKYSKGDLNITLNEFGLITISNKTTLLDKTSVKKIFNRYFTVENARRKSGVGLSIAKQLVELNSGLINAEYKNKSLIITINFKSESF